METAADSTDTEETASTSTRHCPTEGTLKTNDLPSASIEDLIPADAKSDDHAGKWAADEEEARNDVPPQHHETAVEQMASAPVYAASESTTVAEKEYTEARSFLENSEPDAAAEQKLFAATAPMLRYMHAPVGNLGVDANWVNSAGSQELNSLARKSPARIDRTIHANATPAFSLDVSRSPVEGAADQCVQINCMC